MFFEREQFMSLSSKNKRSANASQFLNSFQL